jgi:hypothetical protein
MQSPSKIGIPQRVPHESAKKRQKLLVNGRAFR